MQSTSISVDVVDIINRIYCLNWEITRLFFKTVICLLCIKWLSVMSFAVERTTDFGWKHSW